MPCLGPSVDKIASEQARNNKQVHILLCRLCEKAGDVYIDLIPRRELWWNNGRPEPADKNTIEHHIDMLCSLCESLKLHGNGHLIDKVTGLRAWLKHRSKRLKAEQTALAKAERETRKARRDLVKKLKAAGITPEELNRFGHNPLNSFIA